MANPVALALVRREAASREQAREMSRAQARTEGREEEASLRFVNELLNLGSERAHGVADLQADRMIRRIQARSTSESTGNVQIRMQAALDEEAEDAMARRRMASLRRGAILSYLTAVRRFRELPGVSPEFIRQVVREVHVQESARFPQTPSYGVVFSRGARGLAVKRLLSNASGADLLPAIGRALRLRAAVLKRVSQKPVSKLVARFAVRRLAA